MLDAAKAFLASEYERVRLLKSSARGEVWLVSDKTGRPCVMRIVHTGGLPFARLKAQQGQGTPLWPEILFLAEDDEETVVVEEYVGGRSLEERRIAREWLTEAEARALLLAMAEGLSTLHALGVVHRDIKPAHIFVQNLATVPSEASRSPRRFAWPQTSDAESSTRVSVRLIDFDAARVVSAEAAHDTRLLGTEGYAPPEQFGYGQTDGRSDIYALGVTVRELLGPNFNEKNHLGKVLLRCTEKDPDRRYPDAGALRDALAPSRWWKPFQRTASAAAVAFLVLAFGALAVFADRQNTRTQDFTQTLEDAATETVTKAGEEAQAVRDAFAGKKVAPPRNDVDGAKRNDGATSGAFGTTGPNTIGGIHDKESGANSDDLATSNASTESALRSGRLESTLTFNGAPWDDEETIVLSSDDWRTWERAANGAVNGDYALFFPAGWNVALTLTNGGGAPVSGTLAVAFDGGAHTESDAVPVTLAPGASQTIPIALGGRRIDSADAKTADLALHVSGDGLAGVHDWVLTFYLRSDGGYHVSDELRTE